MMTRLELVYRGDKALYKQVLIIIILVDVVVIIKCFVRILIKYIYI